MMDRNPDRMTILLLGAATLLLCALGAGAAFANRYMLGG